jgi:hypothetical protein
VAHTVADFLPDVEVVAVVIEIGGKGPQRHVGASNVRRGTGVSRELAIEFRRITNPVQTKLGASTSSSVIGRPQGLRPLP